MIIFRGGGYILSLSPLPLSSILFSFARASPIVVSRMAIHLDCDLTSRSLSFARHARESVGVKKCAFFFSGRLQVLESIVIRVLRKCGYTVECSHFLYGTL